MKTVNKARIKARATLYSLAPIPSLPIQPNQEIESIIRLRDLLAKHA